MKKIWLILCIFLLLIACKTTTVNVTSSWTQNIPDASIFGGWEIYGAQSESGTYSLFQKIVFTEVKPVYTAVKEITVPVKKTTVLWFKILAYHKDGTKSEFSNKVKLVIASP